MAEEKYTRCPGCKTIFRVTPQQLAIRAGQVRCGHCQTVFDGIVAQVSLAPRARPAAEEAAYNEAELGPPTVTLRSAQALKAAPDDADDTRSTRTEPHGAIVDEDPEVDQPTSTMGREIAYESRFAPPEEKKRRWLPSWVYALAIPLLIIAFAGHALFHFRDAIAAHWPATKPGLIRMCALADCRLHPLQDIGGLSIEASDLQADPAHKGLLILSATVRNRDPYPVAYPYLELTLSDAQEQIVVRRAFAPTEYISGASDIEAGVGANSELSVKLFIDASATSQAGYQVYLFYP